MSTPEDELPVPSVPDSETDDESLDQATSNPGDSDIPSTEIPPRGTEKTTSRYGRPGTKRIGNGQQHVWKSSDKQA